jgi:hypothetical protein
MNDISEKDAPTGCASPDDMGERLFDCRCVSCMFRGDIVACQSYRIETGLVLVYYTGDAL